MPETLPNVLLFRRIFLTLAAAAAASSQASGADGNDIFHVAIFRFAKENINDAITAFRAIASASRQEPGKLSYDIYRAIDDDQVFYIAEHWASPTALGACPSSHWSSGNESDSLRTYEQGFSSLEDRRG
ncbi:MAG: antibiotic biosynthesis monooxygenase, partial [Xanthobacteraceae bacterium]